MKFFAASLSTETNTFAAAPTGRGSFEEYGIYRGDASVKVPEGGGALLRCLRDAALAAAPADAVAAVLAPTLHLAPRLLLRCVRLRMPLPPVPLSLLRRNGG
jgi:microcystin degradation protein MlrC